MKRINKLFSLLTALSIFFAGSTYAEQVKFTDISNDYWAKSSIEKVASNNIILGYPDGSFKPENSVTRAELVVMVNKLMGYKEKVATTKFKDLKQTDWFYEQILIAEKQGYIAGFEDGTFRPNANITKEQVAVIITKMMNLKQLNEVNIKDSVSSWSRLYVNTILSNKIMLLDKDGKFYAKTNATRALVADVVAKFVQDKKTSEKTNLPPTNPSQQNPSTTNTTTTGGGSSSSGGGASAPTTDNITRDQLVEKAKNVVKNTTTHRENFKTDKEKEIVDDIISNMNGYINDANFDYKSKVDAVKSKYDSLTTEEKEDFKNIITLYNNTKDLLDLKEYLF